MNWADRLVLPVAASAAAAVAASAATAAATIFAGAGLILYGHAIGFMMSGRPCKLHEALGELSGGQWVLFFTILSLPITVLLGLASVVGGG